jgi:hypothetical protein
MSRFYESFPLRTDHTVPNLVAHITPSLPFIIELSSPSHAAFGLLGFPQPPTAASSSAPLVPPSKTALKKAARKGKQGKQRDQHSALLAYMAEQGIAVPPHLAAGALTIPPARPTIPPPPLHPRLHCRAHIQGVVRGYVSAPPRANARGPIDQEEGYDGQVGHGLHLGAIVQAVPQQGGIPRGDLVAFQSTGACRRHATAIDRPNRLRPHRRVGARSLAFGARRSPCRGR